MSMGTTRRVVAVVVVGLLGVGMLAVPAQAGGGGGRERYQSEGLNAFWHSTRRVDRNTYRRTTWYAGAYLSSESGATTPEFWSDLYKSVDRCQKRDGRDRCEEIFSAVGVINDLGTGQFAVDDDLESARLVATYRVRGSGEAWRVTVDATLTGDGEIQRGIDSSEYYIGDCLAFAYDSEYSYRGAIATGSLSGDVTRNLGSTRDAGMSTGNSSYVQNEC